MMIVMLAECDGPVSRLSIILDFFIGIRTGLEFGTPQKSQNRS